MAKSPSFRSDLSLYLSFDCGALAFLIYKMGGGGEKPNEYINEDKCKAIHIKDTE